MGGLVFCGGLGDGCGKKLEIFLNGSLDFGGANGGLLSVIVVVLFACLRDEKAAE